MKSLIRFINEASKGSKKQIKNCKTWKKFFDIGTKPFDEEFNLEYAEDSCEDWIFPINGDEMEPLTAKELLDLYNSKDKIEVEVTFGVGGGDSDEVVVKSSDGKEYTCDMMDAENYFKGKPSRW